jgi:hypothetical protein
MVRHIDRQCPAYLLDLRTPPPPTPCCWQKNVKPCRRQRFKISQRILFGAGRTEWGHLTNHQLAWYSYRQEPVAVRTVLVTLQYSHPNAGMKQYESGRTQPLV